VSDLLDPATLTPESLYKLQSETWMQGVEFERERIIKLLEEYLVDYHYSWTKNIPELIALIKAENVKNNGQEGL
jgi:hypothetical protein